MLKIVFTIPDEIEAFIKDDLKQEPKTYIQNQLIDPIIEKYGKKVAEVEAKKAEEKTATDVAKAKNKMKVELNGTKEVK